MEDSLEDFHYCTSVPSPSSGNNKGPSSKELTEELENLRDTKGSGSPELAGFAGGVPMYVPCSSEHDDAVDRIKEIKDELRSRGEDVEDEFSDDD